MSMLASPKMTLSNALEDVINSNSRWWNLTAALNILQDTTEGLAVSLEVEYARVQERQAKQANAVVCVSG